MPGVAVEQIPHTTSAARSGGTDEAGRNKPAADMLSAADHNRSGRESRSNSSELVDLRKYLLLLAILAATVTYVAGLNPPGGVWLDTQDGHLTGNQILVVTYHARYNTFSYSNATAFMASAVVILLLVLAVNDEEKGNRSALFVVLRLVMVLDLLALVVSYAAGASRDTLTTTLATLLVSPIFAYILLLTGTNYFASQDDDDDDDDKVECAEVKRRHKILMLLAIFATTITYTAGLNPPGGFWPVTQEGHRAGDPVLQGQGHHRRRFIAFFICNTCSFVASLSIIVLLLTRQSNRRSLTRIYADGATVYASILIAILGLLGAYAVGSCRKIYSSTYVGVLCLLGLALVLVLAYTTREQHQQQGNREKAGIQSSKKRREEHRHGLNTARSLVLLLATLAATVTYQAGLNPPGGFWPDDRDGHKGGDPILLTKHATRYRVFFYFNSTALAASLVVIFMVQRNYLSNSDLGRHALEAVMVLDLIGLIGAFAAGCCRDVSTSIYVIALAGGALVYVVFHMVFFTLHLKHDDIHKGGPTVDNKRKLLLLLAILAVTLTYQAGLTPPGGFWLGDDFQLGHHAGDPVLLSNYPRRYTAFFYLNATGFMASVALTILLVNPNLYIAAINCHALYVCMVAALFGLTGAYAAGSSRHLRTSIYMIALIALVFTVILLLLLIFVIVTRWGREGGRKWMEEHHWISACMGGAANQQEANKQDSSSSTQPSDLNGDDDTSSIAPPGNIKLHTRRRYLTLLGILAASVTYQAGLAPPGGVWPDNNDGHAVGNPILRDSNRRRYHIFFYCNSVSFVASVVVITLQLLVRITNGSEATKEDNKQAKFLIQAAEYTMAVDLLGLLGAYAAGSSREWETFGYILALVAAVLLYIVIHILISFCHQLWKCSFKNLHCQQEGESYTSREADVEVQHITGYPH